VLFCVFVRRHVLFEIWTDLASQRLVIGRISSTNSLSICHLFTIYLCRYNATMKNEQLSNSQWCNEDLFSNEVFEVCDTEMKWDIQTLRQKRDSKEFIFEALMYDIARLLPFICSNARFWLLCRYKLLETIFYLIIGVVPSIIVLEMVCFVVLAVIFLSFLVHFKVLRQSPC